MTGTIVNAGAILAGGLIGLAAAGRIPERVKTILMQALGLSTLIIGLQMALSAREVIPIVSSLLLGALTGELLRIEDGLERIGHWLKKRARSDSSTFVTGFVTTSLLYCTGAMVVVGAIQDGTTGNATTLYIKAMLDGVASIAFASTLGIGVLFSAASVLPGARLHHTVVIQSGLSPATHRSRFHYKHGGAPHRRNRNQSAEHCQDSHR